MNYIEQFLAGKIWIHISKENRDLVKDLCELMPGVKFCSGDDLNGKVMDRALMYGNNEAWFRFDPDGHAKEGVSYNGTHPRKSDCWTLAPELYRNGEILDITEILGCEKIDIQENDLEALFEV